MVQLATTQHMVDLGLFPRVDNLPEYILKQVTDLKYRLRQAGHDIVDMGMGNPDGATPKRIVDKMVEAARKKGNHRYSVSKGIVRLRQEIVNLYAQRYGVSLDIEKQTVVTIGAKDAVGRLLQAILATGDVVISTNPAYPIHYFAIKFADGQPFMLPLHNPGDFINRLQALYEKGGKKPRVLLLSFPHNPTTHTVSPDFWKVVVGMARKHNTMVINDFAYADEGFDGYVPPSMLQVDGALDHCVEIFSLSKSYNMAGWRVGFAVGNEKMIKAVTEMKSYMDYGIFQPIQIASIIALRDCFDEPPRICANYQKRRDLLVEGLGRAGWQVEKSKSMMFVYARIPEQYRDMGSMAFSKFLLEKALVATAPGVGFIHGSHEELEPETWKLGDEWVRFALIENEKRINQATRNIKRAFEGKATEKLSKERPFKQPDELNARD